MIHKLIIPGVTPNFNAQITNTKANKGGMYAYNNTKNEWTNYVALQAKVQLRGVRVNEFATVCIWYLPNRKKDPDNISFAIKYILDGLQLSGTIPNDGWKQCSGGILHLFKIDKQNPRVEVGLMVGKNLNFKL